MRRLLPLVVLVVMAGCTSGPKVPPPNSAQAIYDGRDRAVQVTISNIGPPASVALVSASGNRLEAPGITLLAGPHVVYSQPPTIGFGIGGLDSAVAVVLGRASASMCRWASRDRLS
jgi:hypothetical protein